MKLTKSTMTVGGVTKKIEMTANPARCMVTGEDTIIISLTKRHEKMPAEFRSINGFCKGESTDWGAVSDTIRVTRNHPLWAVALVNVPYGEMLA